MGLIGSGGVRMGLGYRAFVSEATSALGLALRLVRRTIRPGRLPAEGIVHAPFTGRVWVVDGDTVVVNRIRVRLLGMDAPELSQYGGLKAKSHLIRLAGGRRVRVVPEGLDCYGRVLATIWLGEVDLGERMVRDGFARGESHFDRRYAVAEAEARRFGAGLWAGNPRHGIRDPARHRASRRTPKPSDQL